ncbi:serine protease inhibitor 42Dd-like [Culex pipiens pallens]|uniref:serine protease inhibitor 42Dd-like n=1 Tax=Culex pipiens pallens TaxID=42434 RepID=UPI001953ABF2|nr:serine protease inhibitor 42Dd-like [Culex pipiens pallens]
MRLLGWVTAACSIVACCGSQLRFPYGDTSFSLAVYKAAFDPDRNIVVAPFVLRNSVVMLYSIATDAVRDKLREVFGLPTNFTEFLTNQKELHYTLGGGGDGFRMKNRIIVNGFREVDVHMRDVMKEDLDTTIAYFDFIQREGVVRRVNHFVNFNTNRAVGGIVKIDDVPKHLQLVQVCAASFRPPFASSFDPKDTNPRDFWSGLIEKLYSTMTMFKRGDFRFSRIPELEIEVLELPFIKSSDAVMWIMLPDRDASLEAIMKALEPGHFDAIQAHFSLKRAEITVPLFSIESEFNATEFLQGIGLDVLFKNRDLRVFEDVDSSLDSVMHRAGIRLHEKTADAGGASVVRSFNKRSSIYQYVVARSYLFVIVKKTSKQILFMGHLHKPDDLVEV